jgi:hypothetical protein
VCEGPWTSIIWGTAEDGNKVARGDGRGAGLRSDERIYPSGSRDARLGGFAIGVPGIAVARGFVGGSMRHPSFGRVWQGHARGADCYSVIAVMVVKRFIFGGVGAAGGRIRSARRMHLPIPFFIPLHLHPTLIHRKLFQRLMQQNDPL